jgi:uncharacterized membrane protein
MQNHDEKSDKEKSVENVHDKSALKPEADVIKSSDSGKSEERKIVRTARSEFYRGPIPHPKALAQYNRTIPDGADRILRLTENEQSHRHYCERSIVDSDNKRSNTGLYLGFILALV